MKNSKLVLLSCLILSMSQMQAMEFEVKIGVKTKPVDDATEQTTIEKAKIDAANKAKIDTTINAQRAQQSGQPVDTALKEKKADGADQSESGVGLEKPVEPERVSLGQAEASGVKEGEKVPDSSENIESKTLFKEEDLVTKDGELAKIKRNTSQSFSQWISSIIESLQRMISGIPKTPKIDVALQDAKDSISKSLNDPTLDDFTKRYQINNHLQMLSNVIAEESSPEVFQKVNQEIQSFSADIQDGLKYYYHDTFRISNRAADSFNLSGSRYENIPQDSSSTNPYVNLMIE